MSKASSSRWPALALAGAALLLVSACAPNSVRAPLHPRATSQSAAEGESSRYGALLRMAASTRASGDSASSVQLYHQAAALEPRRPEAYVLLGDTLVERGAFDEAARSYEQALKHDSDHVAARRGYARALLGLKRPEMAIAHYKAVVAATPDDIQAHNGLGVAHDSAGQHEAAQAAYREGLKRAPESMLLRNNLGLSLALSGQHQEAIRTLRTVVDAPGATARNRQNLALAYGLAGDLSAAERISRLDLEEDAVENNLAYYATLAAVGDRRQRAAALSAHSPEPGDGGDRAAANRRVQAIALDAGAMELGLAPTGRWFLDLGRYRDGQQAMQAWRQLRARHDDLLGGLARLAGTQDGAQPLLVGPLASAESAQSLCNGLKARGQSCRALPL